MEDCAVAAEGGDEVDFGGGDGGAGGWEGGDGEGEVGGEGGGEGGFEEEGEGGVGCVDVSVGRWVSYRESSSTIWIELAVG